MAGAGLHRTIPVRDVGAAAAHYRERLGDHAGPPPRSLSRDKVTTMEFGTREFATLDLDGNLLSFFR